MEREGSESSINSVGGFCQLWNEAFHQALYEGLDLCGGPVINKDSVVLALCGAYPGEKTRGEPGTGFQS